MKPPPKPHRKGQKSYNQKSYEKRDSKSRPPSSRSPHAGEPKNAKHDSVRGYSKKPFRKREDNPLLESAPRPTRYAARFESKAKPDNNTATSSAKETTSNSARRGEVSARSERAQGGSVQQVRDRLSTNTTTQSPNNSDRAIIRRTSPEPVSLRPEGRRQPTAGSTKQEITPNSTRRGEVSARSERAQGGSVQQVRDRLSTNTTTQSPTATGAIRLAKRMSDAGVCSRREAERLIEAGRVTVNGQRITTCATLVSAHDMVRLDDKLIKNTPQEVRLFLFHKPRGALTTNADPEGRPTIYDLLPKDLPRVVSVGRLDFDSEGLLLLTTSGSLARTLELPATGLPRTYRVRIHGTPSPESLAKLKRGMEVDGVRYGSMQVRIEDTDSEGRNRWVEVTLREGKNREIRRVFTALDHHVTRLIRTHYGPFELGKLPRGALIEMKPRDWKKSLRDVLPKEESSG